MANSSPMQWTSEQKLTRIMQRWIIISILFLGYRCHGAEVNKVSFDPHDLTVNEDESNRFDIRLTQPSNESITVFLCNNNEGIAGFPGNVTIPANESEYEISVKGIHAGHVDIWIKETNDSNLDVKDAFTRIAVRISNELDVFSNVVGWGYFLAWGVAFYPQIYTNFRRKSVVGLHFDFLAFNILGFACYAIYNCGVYFSEVVQEQYLDEHPHGIIPVKLNDVLFSLYAVAGTMVVIIQAFFYEKGNQKMTLVGIGINCAFLLFIFISLILGLTDVITWLMYLNFFSYVKLVLTLIKYMPQVYYIYKRKSTEGWNIWNVLLDFAGGSLSILQMFILSANYDDWGSIFGDFTKFGLGFITVLFDIVFMIEHYILYPPSKRPQSTINGDVILATVDATQTTPNNVHSNEESIDSSKSEMLKY